MKMDYKKLNYTKTIEEILNGFDFHKVQKVMRSLNWFWGFKEGNRIPEILEMKTHCRRLLKQVISNKTLESGGFRAQHCKDGSLGLDFIVANRDAYYYDNQLCQHFSFENGHKILVQTMVKATEIKKGSRWISSENYIVTVTEIDLERKELSYIDGLGNKIDKDIFSFQCRYCLIVEDS